MKKLSMLAMMAGAALLCAAPISLHWSPAKQLAGLLILPKRE